MTIEGVLPVNKGLLVGGAVLVGVGGLLGAAGIGLSTYALLTAGREWMKQLETPPSELARRKLELSKLAGRAAAEAWRTQGGGGSAATQSSS